MQRYAVSYIRRVTNLHGLLIQNTYSHKMVALPPVQVFSNARVFTSKEGDDTLYDTLVIQGDKVVYVGDREGASNVVPKVSCGQ